MILSVSRRTDIPCFYSEWFMNRIKAGYVLSRNPMNYGQIRRAAISPDIVDCIVFWTKDPANMLDKLPALDEMGYKYYFQFTLTPYGNKIEKRLRDKGAIEETFIRLSKLIGKEKVLWRYDPIILNSDMDIAFHSGQFGRLCERLGGYTDSVTMSFVDNYSRLERHVKSEIIREITPSEINELAAIFSGIAKKYGLAVKTCCESMDLSAYGIEHASCIDKAIIERICGSPLSLKPDKNQRSNCGCYESVDIGAYGSCGNGCVYCYAGGGRASADKNLKSHDPHGELLIGVVGEDERGKIRDRNAESNKCSQQIMLILD